MSDNIGWVGKAQKELARIDGRHGSKKRNTIIALVTARMRDESEETVWRLSTTCSRNTYHRADTRTDGSRRGWKYNPDFSSVLNNVTEIATNWQSTYALHQLEQRQKDWIEQTHTVGWALIKKAEEMLDFPLHTVSTEDGKTVTEPGKWTFSNIPTMAMAADKLVRMSLSMPTDVRQQQITGVKDGEPINISGIGEMTDAELRSLIENSDFLLASNQDS